MACQERSAGVLLFVRGQDASSASEKLPPSVLLLDYGKHWDFPKGHVEPGESDQAAALRELQEETGIGELNLLQDFSREIRYFFRHPRKGLVEKRVIFFLTIVDQQLPVKLSHEHKDFAYLAYPMALRRLTYANARQVLREAASQLGIEPESAEPV